MSRVFVYENWTHDRVRIHRADCAFMIAKKPFVLPNGLIVTTLNLVRCAGLSIK
jgi:hypothetical protein